jgi:hypothetical protein
VPPRKPKVGRPSLGDAALRSVVSVKLTDAERAQWQAAAERESLSLSEWLRAAAELAIARGSTR